MINFPGQLSDISAKTAALEPVLAALAQQAVLRHETRFHDCYVRYLSHFDY